MKVLVSILLAILVMALFFVIGAFLPWLLVIIALIITCGALAALIHFFLFWR